jgi:hypothetical protein
MIYASRKQPRHGTNLVEFALVGNVVFLLFLGLVIGGMGIFRYQEMAHLARLTARYAASHAGQYAQENSQAIQAGTLPNVNDAYLLNNVVKANAVSMDPTLLQVQVSINCLSGTFDWDNTAATNNRSPYSTTSSNKQVTNTVTVTVTYTWLPEAYLAGPITLQSTAVMPMSY